MIKLVHERANELKLLLEKNDIDRVIQRLLDFAKEFSSDGKAVNNAIVLKIKYADINEQLKRFGPLDKENSNLKTKLIYQILDLIDAITKQYENEIVVGNEKNIVSEVLEIDSDANQHTNNQQIIFSCENISKSYRGFKLKNISFDLQRGEMIGCVGPNGSGKSTLLKIIAGLLSWDEGNIDFPTFKEKRVDWYKVRQSIAYIPEEKLEEREIGLLKEHLHYMAAAKGILGENNNEQINFVLHRLNLEKYLDYSWDEISAGYRIRFYLAQMLVWKPILLIMDEPLANLDIHAQQNFLRDLRDLAASIKNPISIVISSQHLYEIEAIADKIIFLKDGEAIFCGDRSKMGRKISRNLFEVDVPIAYTELCKVFQGFSQEINVQESGTGFIIETPLSILGNQLMSILINQGIKIDYFRDISLSTRKLFDF